MQQKLQRYSLVLTCIVGAVIVFILFKPVIQHPNSYLFSHGTDGIKSYYNFGYYLKYGSGIKHTGVNYPYGDHLLYMNSHPLATQVLKSVDGMFPVSNYGPAFLNLFMICSLVLALPFVFLILRHYRLPGWYAGLISICIVFTSPQLDRIHGHFEMVYLFFIPAFWYFFIKWREGSRPILWLSLTILTGLVGAFTSAFYAAFYGIFFLSYWLIEVVRFRKKLKANARYLILLFLVALIPVIAVKGFVAATDWFSDRPTDPWGYFLFHSNLSSIFLPDNSSLERVWGKTFDMSYEWEGRAYIGTPALVFSLSILIVLIHNIISRRTINWKVLFPKTSLNKYLIASILVLLFAMCLPFRHFPSILDTFPVLKQFRSLGRFSWIFYFVINIYAAFFFYRMFRLMRVKKIILAPGLLLFTIFFIWHLDASVNTKRMMRGLIQPNNMLESDASNYLARFKESKVDPSEFQAIFCLPFINTCGDKLTFQKHKEGFAEGLSCSYYTGLPIIQSYSPRLSFSSALSSIQLLADSSIRKIRVDDMSKKPILLIFHKANLSEREKKLLKKGEVFWESETVGFARLQVNAFNSSHTNYRDSVAMLRKTLTYENGRTSTGQYTEYIYNGFEEYESQNVFNGKGAQYAKGRKASIKVCSIDSLKRIDFGDSVEVSFWVYFDPKVHSMPEAYVQEFDGTGKKIWEVHIDRNTHNVYKNWVLYKSRIPILDGNKYQIEVFGTRITVDDLLIRPVGTNVFIRLDDKTELINNIPTVISN